MARWTGLRWPIFEVLLGLCWPIWGLCWGQVRPSWAMLGLWLRYFQDDTFIPKLCLKKLSPVACESHVWIVCRRFAGLRPLPSGLRVSRFERFRPQQWPASPLGVNVGLRRAVLQPCWAHVAVIFSKECSLPAQWRVLKPVWAHVGRITRSIWTWADTIPGLCWPILGYVGAPSGVYVGATFAHLEAMLALCWPMWGLCWGQVRPSWGCWGYVGPSRVYVGATLAHLGACWGYVDPPEVILGTMLFSWVHLHFQILLEEALPSGLRASCLDSLSKICLFLSSPQWPASLTFRAFLLPLVACESQVPPIEGVGGA